MEKKIFTLLFFTFLTVFNAFSQVVIEGQEEETEEQVITSKRAQKRDVRDLDSVTQLYMQANWSSTFRVLEPNGELFGQALGERGNEQKANFWSYGIGLRNKLAKHFELEVGIGLTRNGEQYAYNDTDTDSTFAYTTRYTFVSLPIVGYFTYGRELKLLAGAGIMPQLFMNQLETQNFTSAINTQEKNEIKTKSGTPNHTTFTSSALFRVGVQLRYSPFWSIYIMPEYRVQLTSTYGKTYSYSHKANALGFNLGLTYQL